MLSRKLRKLVRSQMYVWCRTGSLGTFEKFADNANVKVVSINCILIIVIVFPFLGKNYQDKINFNIQEELTISIQRMIRKTGIKSSEIDFAPPTM